MNWWMSKYRSGSRSGRMRCHWTVPQRGLLRGLCCEWMRAGLSWAGNPRLGISTTALLEGQGDLLKTDDRHGLKARDRDGDDRYGRICVTYIRVDGVYKGTWTPPQGGHLYSQSCGRTLRGGILQSMPWLMARTAIVDLFGGRHRTSEY